MHDRSLSTMPEKQGRGGFHIRLNQTELNKESSATGAEEEKNVKKASRQPHEY